MALEFTDENFEREVLESTSPVLVDFWAPWCGPCRKLSPVIDQLAREMTDAKIGKVNVDEAPGIAAEYNISSIPALLFFKSGKVAGKMVGLQSAAAIKEKLESLR